MTIYIFGNPDLPEDALPVRLKVRLQEQFPDINFRLTDPNELDLPESGEDFVAIDTVVGLKDVREITVDEIAARRTRSTAHDYDFATFILMAQKLRPSTHIRIFGIPMSANENKAIEDLVSLIKSI